MDLASNYDIARTAGFIRSRNFTRVALQFPDELLKDSTKVVSALRNELIRESDVEGKEEYREVRLFVMADTTYGSCCVDEVGASHVDAECVVHYGHTCLSPTSTLPALFVFGKASICVQDCVTSLSGCLSNNEKRILVLFGLEYAHAMHCIKEAMVVESSSSSGSISKNAIHYADVLCSVMDPKENPGTSNTQLQSSECLNAANRDCAHCDQMDSGVVGTSYTIGGLMWNLPEGHKMEDYMLFWIGSDNAAFANVVLTYNRCDTVRYDPMENHLVKDVSNMKRIIMRRYYLVEKAKDSNIVGILVGTLGVAGYLHMIHQMKELIMGAGKKVYTLVMGRPNPAKLANFPECDVFVYVSCAQTALLDSKEFLAPVITPFKPFWLLAGRQWTGAYVMEFRDLIAYPSLQVGDKSEEARFSFLQGGYVEDLEPQESEKDMEENERSLHLAETAEKSLPLQLHDKYTHSLVNGKARTGAEFFVARSFRGLDIQSVDSGPRSFVLGRSGKAAGYKDENSSQENI